MSFSMLDTKQVMPHLTFSEESVEDRAATIAQGHPVNKSVNRVTIRQPGSKDDVEKDAEPWLETLHMNPNWMPEWVERAKSMYRQWKEGFEPTGFGTHLKEWPPISKAELGMLLAAGIRTVEELSSANEQVISRIGMGGRALKLKAADWLATAKNGAPAAELTALREQAKNQSEQIAMLMAQLQKVVIAQGTAPAAPAPEAPAPETPKAPKDDFLAE